MSSWFARTIASTLELDEEESADENDAVRTNDFELLSPNRGVKEDLSELTKTVTRQLWGVASFLAPPPLVSPNSGSPLGGSDPDGMRNDFAEIGVRFKSGLSKLASVSEITTKMASNFLELGSDEREGSDAVGVSDVVMAFVSDIVMHPETWLSFPVPDNGDFDMSDAQQEHAVAVEQLVPRLAALRAELCPSYMSEACFWKIYFILLHPRLDQPDAEVLSTRQIVEANKLTYNIMKPTNANAEQDWSGKGSSQIYAQEHISSPSTARLESVINETSACESNGNQIFNKSVIEEGNAKQRKDQNLHSTSPAFNIVQDNANSKETTISIHNDVSFSDLEEDEGDVPTSYIRVTYNSDSSTKDSRDWVQLSRNSTDSAKDVSSVSSD